MNEGELGYGVKGGGVESLLSGLTTVVPAQQVPAGRSHSKNYLDAWQRRRRRHCDGGRVR